MLLTLALYLVIATLMLAFILALRSARLRQRFEKMGTLPGRPLAEIIEKAGKPSHRGRIDEHREMVEWRRINFHVALTFKDGICDGVAYQGR